MDPHEFVDLYMLYITVRCPAGQYITNSIYFFYFDFKCIKLLIKTSDLTIALISLSRNVPYY